MEITLRIDCTPTEARQMLGIPDLLPLHQCLSLALEDCLTLVVAGLTPSPDAEPDCDDRRARCRSG